MRRYRMVFIGVLCLALIGFAASAAMAAGEAATITGSLNAEGQFVADSGQAYEIFDDEQGAKLFEQDAGKKIEVQGVVESEGDVKVIHVQSFKVIE